MTRIGLISDTHSFLDEAILKHFENCDEIWHAGDFGTIDLAKKLASFKPIKGVYGNIDGNDIQNKRFLNREKNNALEHIIPEKILQLLLLLYCCCL